jgi:predicted RNase H-like nuclease (RuvC/YqgF family)
VSARTSALDAVVYGVDVQSGDVRGDAPSYAVVAFDGETTGRDVVSHRKLRRVVDDETPAILATDNVYELAADKDDLVRFLRWLPDETSLVQVTGGHDPEPLSRVADRHGVPYSKDPMGEAEAAARLAAANVGHEVTAFTDRTRVKVSRGRSTGKGGWSEDRYTRRIHGAVKRRSREVRDSLEGAALDYEREVTEKYGGYSSAVFRVEGRPSEIPVSTGRAGDVRVEMERERTDGIEYAPLVERRDPVVVGVDPGTTTAAAVVGLDGTVLDRVSTRTADTADLIEWIVDRGRPVVVAADVTPMPETVDQVRRSFDAAGWTPDRDLPVDEKQHRTREVGYDDDHQRDAAAAALSAFDDHADQFDRVARETPPGVDGAEALSRVVADEQSIEAVLSELVEDDGGDGSASSGPEPPEPSPEQRRINDLERQVDRLQSHVEDLEADLADRDDRIEDLEAELSERRREEREAARERREVSRLQRDLSRVEDERDRARERAEELEEKLARLKELWKLDHSNFSDVADERAGLVPVKPVAEFTRDAIRAADEAYGLAEDDVVYLRNAGGAGTSTAELLVETDPRVVLKRGGLSEAADRVLFEHEVPVADADPVTIQEVDDLAVARESEVEAAIDRWRDRARERRRERTEEMVDQVISEHRAGDL